MKDIKIFSLLFLFTLSLFSCDYDIISHKDLIALNSGNENVPMSCKYFNTNYLVVNLKQGRYDKLGDVKTALLQCSYLVYKYYGVKESNKIGMYMTPRYGKGYYEYINSVYFSFNDKKKFYISGDNFYKLGSMFLSGESDENLLIFFNKNLKRLDDRPLFKGEVNSDSFLDKLLKQ